MPRNARRCLHRSAPNAPHRARCGGCQPRRVADPLRHYPGDSASAALLAGEILDFHKYLAQNQDAEDSGSWSETLRQGLGAQGKARIEILAACDESRKQTEPSEDQALANGPADRCGYKESDRISSAVF